ncbi:TRAP transporter large permease [Pseudogracilibacillus auburnensis]|uniref:TRAP transporter large permease n=1 Tax=Pseudogracilibacillus auburnensis TaxID=1494959 RepID=UPI001A970976|nr:TRAP transporter large permease [Pseudogracilibacillus auburnensis]MBO1003247.1 TRAP transporter large permease [Pseudogracilibacillus auburnensis]
MIVFGCIALLLLLIFIGMPIGFTLIVVGSIGIFLVGGMTSLTGILSTTPYSSVNGFTLTTIPLFILMANFIAKSNIARDLYQSILKWIGHVPGGVGISTVFASAGFGALSGSSVAATAIMSKICIPELVRAKHKDTFAAGLVASSTGTLSVLIPPSIPLVLYGIQTENSIGKLLISGILPGIMLAILLSIFIVFSSLKLGSRTEASTWKERFVSLKIIWPMIILVFLVLGVIYLGITTSTEAAAFGALGALVIGIILKRLNYAAIKDAFVDAVQQTAMIFTIAVGSYVFSYFITLAGIGQSIMSAISASGYSKWTILALVILFYLIIGLFMDMIGSLLLTLPLVYPIITSLGFDGIWFGVIVVLLLEIGLVTPPVGINLFITSKYTNIPVQKVFLGTLPFIGILLFMILLLTIFPQIVLYLPNNM